MRRAALTVVLLVFAAGAALALDLGRAEGNLVIDGTKIDLGYAYAIRHHKNQLTSKSDNTLIVLTDKDLYTLPVALASLSREHVQDNELMMAGSVLTTLPVLVVFIMLQRYYVQGLMVGSVKG